MDTILYRKETIFLDSKAEQDYTQVFDMIGCKNVFAVCSESAKERYGRQLFSDSQIAVTWFGSFASNPIYEDVAAGVELFRKDSYDAVVSIGGGSAIDVAKAILAFSNMDPSRDYMEQEITESKIPHLAVPTTAGTGSESTHFAVVYVNGEKKSIAHESLLPDYALLEPLYLESLPLFQKKCTVLDALCQAIESYWSVKSTEESRGYAKEAINLILRNIDSYIAEKDVVYARIIKAANLAGRAIDITQTTAAHAMSYKLTSLYGIPHGFAVAVCLPFVWEMFLTNIDQCIDQRGESYLLSIMRDLQELFGTDSLEHTIMMFRAILARMEINLNNYQLADNLDVLAQSVNIQRLGNFPIHLSEQNLREIYQKAFEKEDIFKPEYEMILEIASNFRSLDKKKYKIQKKILAFDLQTLDRDRTIEAAWFFYKSLEYMLEYPEDTSVLCLTKERQYLWGMMASYIKQTEAGLYYVNRIKDQLEILESKYGPSKSEKLAEKLCSVIPMKNRKMYLYVRQAYVTYQIKKAVQLEKLCALFGIQDSVLLCSIFEGLLYQFGLNEYHYFTEQEEQACLQILSEVSILEGNQDEFWQCLKAVFQEKPQEQKSYDILCWQYIVNKSNEIRMKHYLEDVRTEQKLLLKEVTQALGERAYALCGPTLENALNFQEYSANRQGITIAVSDALAVIEADLQKKNQVLKCLLQENVLYVYHNNTKWLSTEDDVRGLGIYIKLLQMPALNYGTDQVEFAGQKYRIPDNCDYAIDLFKQEMKWAVTGQYSDRPSVVEIGGKKYVFNETRASGAAHVSSKKKKGGTIRKIFRKIKQSVMHGTKERPVAKEIFRRILEFKRKVVYTLRYKYKFQVDDKIVLFESYHGKNYNCNPRGVYEAMLKDERYLDYTFVWAFKEPEKYRYLEDNFSTIVVKSASKKYYKYCASAKYIVLNLLLRPQITLKKEQTYIQTWHGKPIKTIGCGKRFETDPRRRLKDTYRHFTRNGKRITKLLSPSDFFGPVMGEAFNFTKLKKNRDIVPAGYPRNDALFQYQEGDIMRIKQQLGIDPEKKVILYAPTWRELFSDYIEKEAMDVVLRVSDSIDFADLHQELGDEYLILFRAHHLDAKAMDISRYGDFIIDVTEYENVNDLYIISDLMISDYSGTIFDFGVLKRPMVFYMFDRELYTTKLQGVNIDLDELPGIFVEREEELAPAIKKQFAEFQYDEKYERFNQKYNQYDDGHSGQRVIDQCMPDNVLHKTLTTQAVKKFIKQKMLFFTKPLKKLKLNFNGLLREKGIIKDDNTSKLLELKNKYAGQRCFLVGNGPSLTAEDLDMIADEVTFGCNMVYKMFQKTKWRPTYHFIVDIIYTKNLYREIKNNITSPMITHNIAYRSMKQKPDNIAYVNTFSQEDYQIRGNMLAYYIPARATVMTFMIEMAMFMGFKEIYLLGTDCTNSFTSGHFGEEYVASDLDKVNLARARRTIGNPNLTLAELGEYRRERSIGAYQKIALYAKKADVKIYNTTRGGALEVFPRKNLEDVLS
jgi:Alcohol dehydrogenase, class IV